MSRRCSPILPVLGLVLALVASPATAEPSDPFSGVWTLAPGPRLGGTVSQVLTISVRDDEETYRSELLTTDGRLQITDYVARYDGREYPSATRLTGGGGPDESRLGGVVLHRTDRLTRERHWKQDGRVFRILRRTVSADGCEMSSQLVEVAADGSERPGGILTFERREPSCRPPPTIPPA